MSENAASVLFIRDLPRGPDFSLSDSHPNIKIAEKVFAYSCKNYALVCIKCGKCQMSKNLLEADLVPEGESQSPETESYCSRRFFDI